MGLNPVKWSRFAPALVLVAGVLAYANSFTNTFILDDAPTVLRERLAESHLWPLRCIVDFSFKINLWIGGHNVADYHAVNLLIHLIAGLCLYGIVRRTLQLPRFGSRYTSAAPWLAAVSAALWAAHPLQTESVTYICQRYESLMGMFYLLTLYAFIRIDSAHPAVWRTIAVAACALGMGSKENMATAPLMILLYDFVFLSAGWRQVVNARWRMHAALLGTWAVLLLLFAKRVSLNADVGVPTVSPVSPMEYLTTQFGVVSRYLWLAAFPRNLCLDYAWPPTASLAEAWPAAVFILVLIAGTVWAVKRRAGAGFLGAWFFVTLAPTSSLLPMGDMAFEHRMYLPLAGPVCLGVVGVYGLFDAMLTRLGPVRRWVWAIAALAVLTPAIQLTRGRNADYRSELAMWQDVIDKRPHNCRAQSALATALLKEWRFKEAEAMSRRLLSTVDRLEGAGEKGYRLSPIMANYYRQLALNEQGQALLGQGKLEVPADCFRRAREKGGGLHSAYHLAQALHLLGRDDEAMTICESVLAKDPCRADARILMGFVLEQRKKYPEAIACYRKAVALAPDSLSAKCQLAWVLATCPDNTIRDGAEALRLAQEVSGDTGGFSWKGLDVLGAAHAENGHFDDAIRVTEKAVEMASERLDMHAALVAPGNWVEDEAYLAGRNSVEDMKRRIELYREGKAYRDER